MNTRDEPTPLPDDLRWQLRGLRRDIEPATDLWEGIATGITATPQATTLRPAAPSRHRRTGLWFAAAAVLVLAVGMGWQLRPDAGMAPAGTAPVDAQTASGLLVTQADAMSREYEAALREVEAARDLETTPAVLAELDASVAAIRAALAQAPDSRFLFDQLQRVYAQRLALTQRLVSA